MSVVAETAWYVYGVAEAQVGESADTIVEGDLAAVVHAVPLADFDPDVLPERLNDRAWLEERARAHNDLLKSMCAHAPVVPFRFGTVYRDAADVRGLLRERGPELRTALARVRGRVEMGLKAWAVPEAPASAVAEAASGREYLQRRLGAQQAARRRGELLSETVRDVHERLLRAAADGRVNRPQSPELSGRDDTMILNAAYLVADPDAFRREVALIADDVAGTGVELEVTGPWPPYNFVEDAVG